jgi:hypothetical protein
MPNDSAAWRSEVVDGRVEVDDKSLDAWSVTKPPLRVAWERRGYWEGARTALQLSTSKTTTPTTSEVTLYSNDDATATDTNYVNIASTQLMGDLPAPLEYKLKMVTAGMSAPKAYLANTVFADPSSFDPFLLGGEAEDGAAGSWTGSGDTNLVWVWRLANGQMAACAGQLLRLLVTFTSTVYSVYMRPVCYAYVDPVTPAFQPLHVGAWRYVDSVKIIDLPALPIPPGGYDASIGSVAVGISVRHTGAGSATVDFAQLTPSGDGLFRVLDQTVFNTEANDYFVDDPYNRLAYIVESGGAHQPLVVARHDPVYVWPNRTNRLRVLLSEAGGFTAGRQLTMQAWYRPRRAVL